MPESDSDHGVDEALEGEIVEEGAGDRSAPGPAGPTRGRESSALTFGAVLVVVGAVLFAYRFSDTLAAGSAPLVIGLGFVTWWAIGGGFGLVVPGGVLGGIGVGLVLQEAGFYGDAVPLGLGLGFLVIVGLFGDTSAWESLGGFGWPLILIAVGVVVLVVALSRRGTRR